MKITLCASLTFVDKIILVREDLLKSGVKVFTPNFNSNNSDDLIKDHYNKIQKSDAILVLNYEKEGVVNYIGGSTFLEMGFAYILNKKIYLLNPLPNGVTYLDEIKLLNPIIINNDLTKIV